MRYRFRDINGGCVGAIDIDAPGAPGRFTVSAIGVNKADALAKAATLAERIATDPAMASLLPRGTLGSVLVAKGLSAAAMEGPHVVGAYTKRITSPGKRALAIALHREAVSGRNEEVGWFPIVLAAASFLASPDGQKLVGQISNVIVKAANGSPKAQAKLEVIKEHSKEDPVLAKATKIAAMNVTAEAQVSDPEVGFDLMQAANFLFNPLEHIKHTKDILKGKNPLDRLKKPKPKPTAPGPRAKVPPPDDTVLTPTPETEQWMQEQEQQQQQYYDEQYYEPPPQRPPMPSPYYEDYQYYDERGYPAQAPQSYDQWGRPILQTAEQAYAEYRPGYDRWAAFRDKEAWR